MGLGFCRGLEGLVDHAHLRTVAVSDHHLVAKGDKIDDRPGGVSYGLHLSGEIVAQRIPAESENNFFTHSFLSLRFCSADGLVSGGKGLSA